MRCFLLLSLIVAHAVCMPDSMCFMPSPGGPSARLVIGTNITETSRGCKVACGNGNGSMRCSKPAAEIFSKQATGCPARSNDLPVLNSDPDPCVSGFYLADVKYGQSPICPRNAQNYILRGVDEFGTRLTLDNDIYNKLTLNATRNLWQFSYPSREFFRYFVAISCAISSGSCGCSSLPLVRPNLAGGVEAQTGVNGACANPSYILTIFSTKYPPGSNKDSFQANVAMAMTITCEAGIWILRHLDNSNGWQIANATCAP
ncbi:hypothetical protein PRIPAC_91452 [Pristionchus pacificus]|uniref:Uncharacterized protein n=1 Tax=Pristionchus pacificus TaxID=54126 RepID=A0A2A6CGJ0_PRIPA|nr:hypothetical protein PRIPAC_91452 [Pristionchus pacificus]|eukprot:PDM77334.1 hypothetical protein PRIPAC_35534 [Pristionchus pacificus]